MLVRLAFVKLALERFAPFRFEFTNEEPEASMRVRILPDKSALAKMELRTVAPERSVLRMMADVKSVPVMTAFFNDAPDMSVFAIFALVMTELLKFALFRLAELKFVFVIFAFARDAPRKFTPEKFVVAVNVAP